MYLHLGFWFPLRQVQHAHVGCNSAFHIILQMGPGVKLDVSANGLSIVCRGSYYRFLVCFDCRTRLYHELM